MSKLTTRDRAILAFNGKLVETLNDNVIKPYIMSEKHTDVQFNRFNVIPKNTIVLQDNKLTTRFKAVLTALKYLVFNF